jgi:serine protease Do
MQFTSRRPRVAMRSIAVCMFVLFLVGLGLQVLPSRDAQASAQQSQRQAQNARPNLEERIARSPADPEQLRHALAVSQVFQDVARAVGPSVVNITTMVEVQPMPQRSPFGPGRDPFRDPFFDDFFERFFGPRQSPQIQPQPQESPQNTEPQLRQRGLGSGLIIREDGLIVTNNHVVAGSSKITVRLTSGREYEATIVGTDPETDLAVLRIDAGETLTAATLGDSDLLNPGEWVIAVGSALGFENTVTTGVVSATGRRVGILGHVGGFENFIQTDAAINPGNSGGPLLNIFGEVIGINTAIATRTGGYMGIGFAIPSSMVDPIVRAIVDDGKVERGWLGVEVGELTQELAEAFHFSGTDGAVLTNITPGTPAEEADLRHGDIVTAINGTPIKDANQLRNTIALQRPGAKVTLKIFREGEILSKDVTLGLRPTLEELAAQQRERLPGAQRLGLSVEDLTPQMAQQMGLRRGGVLVTEVDQNSPAARVGIRPNHVILTVGRREVANVVEFNDALATLDLTRPFQLRILTERGMTYVSMRLPRN